MHNNTKRRKGGVHMAAHRRVSHSGGVAPMCDDSGDGMEGLVSPLLGDSLGPAHLWGEPMRSSIHESNRSKIGESMLVTDQSTGGWRLGWMRGTGEGSYSQSREGKVDLCGGVSAWRYS
jgi:hypothetical protein